MNKELELKFKLLFKEVEEKIVNAKTVEEKMEAERELDATNTVYKLYLEHGDIMEKLS